MPLRPAAGKHEPPSPPRQDQQQQQHTHSHTLTHPYTHTANGSRGASIDSSSSREEDSGVPVPVGVPAFCPGAQRSHSARAPMEEPTGNTVVIRIGIPDLQQTVRACSVATAGERIKEREAASPPASLAGCFLTSPHVCLMNFSLIFSFFTIMYFHPTLLLSFFLLMCAFGMHTLWLYLLAGFWGFHSPSSIPLMSR